MFIYQGYNEISGEDNFSDVIDETDGRGGVGRQGWGSGLGLSGW